MINSISELFRAAETLEASGNAAGAAELYKRWTALNPEDPHLAAALFNMAVGAQRSGDGFGAIHALRQASRLNPDFHPPSPSANGWTCRTACRSSPARRCATS